MIVLCFVFYHLLQFTHQVTNPDLRTIFILAPPLADADNRAPGTPNFQLILRSHLCLLTNPHKVAENLTCRGSRRANS